MLSIKWKSNCKFELTFIGSNDSSKNALSKVGDKYIYEIVRSNHEKLVLSTVFNGNEYQIDFYKVV